MVVGQVFGRFPPARLHRRAAGETFQAVAVKRADAGEWIGREIVGQADVAHLGVHETVRQLSVEQPAAADSRSNRQVDEGVQPAAGAPALLGQRRGVDVGIEADRHAKRGARGAGDRDVRPAGLWRRGDLSVGRRISPQIHRPEGGDTDGGERPLPILFRRQEIQRLLERPLRRGRRESRLGTDVVWPRADKADELRAACFDRTKGLRHHGSAAYFRRDSAVNGSLGRRARPALI